MNRINQVLLGTLALQLVIAGGIYAAHQAPTSNATQTPLLAEKTQDFDLIVITTQDKKHIQLDKAGKQWKLHDYYQLPVNPQKIASLLDKLETTRLGWPVATSSSSLKRFEVSDDRFQKKISFQLGDKVLETIYLGTSPGFRQLHVRPDDSDDVYAVKLNSYDFPTEAGQWLDKKLLQPGSDITDVSGKDFALSKRQQEWKPTQNPGHVVKDQLNKLLHALAGLNVQSVAQKTFDKADYELSISNDKNNWNYQFYQQDKDYFVKRNDYDQVFKISKGEYNDITRLTADKLVSTETAPVPDSVAQQKKAPDGSPLLKASHVDAQPSNS